MKNRNIIVLFFILFLLIFLIYIYPILLMFISSFKDKKEILIFNPFALPKSFTNLSNYYKAWKSLNYLRSASNTLIITIVSVGLTSMLSSLCAYAISRGLSRYFNILYFVFVGGLLIPYQAIFTPIYFIGSKIGFLNNLLGVSLLYTAGQLPFGVFMLTGFMRNIPQEVEEATIIDGASTIQTFLFIILPLLKPAIMTLAVLRALLVWNDYLLAASFLTAQTSQTLMPRFASLFGQYQSDFATAFAAVFFLAMPIILFFIFNQRNIERGIAGGAIKG